MFFPLIIRQISQICRGLKKPLARLSPHFKKTFENRVQLRIWKIPEYNYICGKLMGFAV